MLVYIHVYCSLPQGRLVINELLISRVLFLEKAIMLYINIDIYQLYFQFSNYRVEKTVFVIDLI